MWVRYNGDLELLKNKKKNNIKYILTPFIIIFIYILSQIIRDKIDILSKVLGTNSNSLTWKEIFNNLFIYFKVAFIYIFVIFIFAFLTVRKYNKRKTRNKICINCNEFISETTLGNCPKCNSKLELAKNWVWRDE